MRIYCYLLEAAEDKDRNDCAFVLVSSFKIKRQIADYRQQKLHQFDIFQKTSKSEVFDENRTINDLSCKEVKHTWPAGTCVIVGDSIIAGVNEKRLSKRCLKKCIILGVLLYQNQPPHSSLKEPDVIIVLVGTNESVSRTLREILYDLLQHKSDITKTLSNCKLIFMQPTF